MSQSPTSAFAKTAIFFAVAFSIGVGLCGLDFFLASRGIRSSHGGEIGVGPLDVPSLLIMLLSGIGLIVSLIAWFIAAIVFGITHRSDPPPTILHSSHDSSDTDTTHSR